MAEFKFPCPQCGQHIQCDTGYSGAQINCPSCQKPIVVPPAPPPAMPVTPQAATSSAIRRGTPVLESAQTPVRAKSRITRNVLVIAAAVIVLAGLVIGGWYGYSKIRIHILRGHLPLGAVALWSGSENGKDSAGWNNATLTDITFAKDNMGQAFRFNGKSSTIKIPAQKQLDLGVDKGFTLMMWIKPTDVNGLHPIMQWSDENMLNLWIGIRPNDNGVLRGDITDEKGNHFLCSHPDTLKRGAFQHIAFTYDKDSGMGVLYVNGVVVARRNLGGNLVAKTKGDILLSQIDRRPGNWSTDRAFTGLMDEIGIYNRALSASEIQAICSEQNHGEPLTLPESSDGWFESWMR